MEKQDATNDGWNIIGCKVPLIKVNEGVRKHNIHELDLNGFPDEDVKYINTLISYDLSRKMRDAADKINLDL